jgi:hypothetical protein
MSFDVVKEQATRLAVDDRRRLVAYLIALDDAQDGAYRRKLREKIDDQTPANWLTIEEMDKKLGTGNDS